MTVTHSEIRRGAYYDSVVLMQLQRGLLQLPGVADAGVVMATPANRDLLTQSDLLTAQADAASPDDLLIVVRAESDAAAIGALAKVDDLLARRRAGVDSEFRPRGLDGALKLLPDAGWVLVSVPGRYAASVAREALALDRHVFLYSDNVSLDDEIALKQSARDKGLLVMGPDCGTAIVNGVGLGFANRVRRGAIGLIGASGTGLQAITSAIHSLGGGISHAIGTGGRDLKLEVGAITAHQALEVLTNDASTRVIVLVSKPPSPEVAAKLLTAAQATAKPIVVDFIGYPPPARRLGNLHFAASLTEAAQLAIGLLTADAAADRRSAATLDGKFMRGLFSGGTLAYEAMIGLQPVLFPLYSNAPLTPSQQLADTRQSNAHTILDLGDDEFTVGRLHPMMDNDLRIRRLKQEAADPDVGLILLDVVLGEGAHADPASELAPAISSVKKNSAAEVVVMLVGTDEDPQDIKMQATQLEEAGALVFTNVAEAIAHVSGRFAPAGASTGAPPVSAGHFSRTPLAAINVGVESFYDSLKAQGAEAVQVDWRPPAAGNEKLMSILAKMKKKN